MLLHEEIKNILHCCDCRRSFRENMMMIADGQQFRCPTCYRKHHGLDNRSKPEPDDMFNAQRVFKEASEAYVRRDIFFQEKHQFPELKKERSLTPKDITGYLDRNIIGQEQTKKTLAVAVYNHHRRIHAAKGEAKIPKSNVLMQGPTGSGKTYILQKLAELLEVPFYIADASSMTENGYKGNDIESVLTGLYQAAGEDIEKTQKGIVYLDEFDKLSTRFGYSSNGQNSVGANVQRQILKMLEGHVMDVPKSGTKKTDNTVKINTENILFICGGAFVGIRKENDDAKRCIAGFGVPVQAESNRGIKQRLGTKDFIDYGLIPEVVGRLPIIVSLDELGEEQLVDIMLHTEESLVKSYQRMLADYEVELIFEEDAVREIAHQASERRTGARGLSTIVEGLMQELMYEIPSNLNIRRCTITKEAVHGTEDIRIEYHEEEAEEKERTY